MTRADRIEAAAARWLARRDAAPLTSDEEAAFKSWCAEDPRHLGAFVRLEAVNAHLARAAALKGMAMDASPRRRIWMPAAAAAAIVAALFGGWQLIGTDQAPLEQRVIATHIGEQYRASLPDGSLVELNTATRLTVELEPGIRIVRMASGEAAFEVAKDPRRPFLVSTQFGDVRAVGTAFSVRVDSGLRVLVSEGAVDIEKEGRRIARVAAGERFAIVGRGDAVRASSDPEEIKRALLWREGRIAFAGETLEEAAREFNRYNEVKIEVADANVGALRFGGYFRATDPEGFTAALEQSLPVEARREGEKIILTASR